MTQEIPLTTSTHRVCPSIDISSKQIGYIAIALGITLLVGGIFLTLAAYNILPNGINAISDLWILGYGTLISGSFVAAYGLWKTFSQNDLNKPVIDVESLEHVQDSVDQGKEWTGEEWNQQIIKAAKVDTKAGENGWKRGIGKNEVAQTFEDFVLSGAAQANANRDILNIVIIDEGISKEEHEILQIVSDYLKVVHGVTVTLTTNYTLTDKDRRRDQYASEPNIIQIANNLPENAFVIGFTSKDLYPYEARDKINFIFGQGIWQWAAGLFSIHRIKSSSFETTLIRLMRLASHEFGHMRGLDHCTQFECCMQGVNSMHEADQVPLTFCALDMTKICCLNNWSLKEGYQRQLDFFAGFENKYGKRVNFAQEIQNLKRKIQSL